MSNLPNFPTIRPSLLLDFANSKQVDPRIAVTRASTATYYDAQGVLRTAASEVPRINHNPATGECDGLLIEEARTNLLTYSEQFDNAAWSALIGGTGVAPSITQNSIVAPDGTTTADRVVFNTGGGVTGSDQSAIRQPVTTALGTIYAGSLWLKGEVGGEQIVIRHAANTNYTLITLTTAWQRFSVIETGAVTTSTYFTIGIRQGQIGIGTINPSAAVHIWGAQLEAGSNPTSYIPTTSAAATRATDVASMSGVNFSEWYRQDEGTFVASFSRALAAPSTRAPCVLAVVNGVSSANSMGFAGGYGNPAQQRFDVQVAGVMTAQLLLISGITSGQVYVAAAAYKLDDMAGSFDGGFPVTDTSSAVPTVDNLLIGGFTGTTNSLNGHLRRIAFYPKRLSNAELQALTA